MKKYKIILLVSILVICLSGHALADLTMDFSSLTDTELDYLKSGVEEEISARKSQQIQDDASFSISDYSLDFDYERLFRHPESHFGEKYVIKGSVGLDPNTHNAKNGGYEGLWLTLIPFPNERYVVMNVAPMGFNILKGDWLEVYATITGFDEYYAGEKTFIVHVEAMNVFESENGELIDSSIN